MGVAALSLTVLRPPGALADVLLTALSCFLGAGWLLARRAGLERVQVRRRLPRVATRGEALTLVHELSNEGGGLVRNLEVSEQPAALGTTTFPNLLPGATASAVTRTFAGRRGLLELGAVSLRGGDPFGLFTVEERRPLPGQVLIRPRPRRLEGRLALDRLQREQRGREGADWEGVREWRPGDPLRRVHWRLSARRGFPVVRVAPRQPDLGLTLVLDLRAPGEDERAGRAFERAVALAAGVGLSALERGGRLTLISAPGEVLEADLRGRSGAARLLSALARVTPLAPQEAPPVPPGCLLVSALSDPGSFPGVPALVLAGGGGPR